MFIIFIWSADDRIMKFVVEKPMVFCTFCNDLLLNRDVKFEM